jgi:small subunit ribosomal protein S16
MIKIKLIPKGKKHHQQYRIVVQTAREKRDGRFLEILGFYSPEGKKLTLDRKSLKLWQNKGAQLTSSVKKLLTTKID